MTTTTKQNMIAVSITSKNFVQDSTKDFGGPSKTKEFLAASEREIVDGMVSFIEATRYVSREEIRPVMVEEMNDAGEIALVDSGEVETVTVEVDSFAETMAGILAARMDSVRVNTAGAKLKEAQDELAILKAQLAALTGQA
jgi:hypothetical protein